MHHDQNFISLSYTNVDFLIPKTDVFTALSCVQSDFTKNEDGEKKIKIASQLLSYIDFDIYAKTINQQMKEVHTKNCIILNCSNLIPNENQIALITCAECRVKQIPYKDFSLFSDFYGELLNKKGILACKFNSDNKLSYLIETETFLKKYLEL